MPDTAGRWTVAQLADFELGDRRTELEQMIADPSPSPAGPDMAVLKAELDEITREQEARGPGRLARRG